MKVALILALGASLFGQTKKPADVCSPPANRVSPSLPAKLLTGQGTEYIKFPITTRSAEAQQFFLQGVAQMHSFWAVEAERSFLQAAALDPDAPMPWWGVAMVAAGDYRPRFQLENYGTLVRNLDISPRVEEAARKALELSSAPGKATDLEKLYIAAIVARRDIRVKNQDAAYIQGLRDVVAKYPDQVEAKSYLALHLMRGFELPEKKPREGSMEAVEILKDLAAKYPDHPGVHHYIIHGWEGSTFAKDAWDSCKRYAELVTNIPHALHMPGHIYSQTGRWDAAVKSFSDAADNERKWLQADSLYSSGHHGHNVHYLSTAESFQGHVDEAIKQARHLLNDFKENPREAAAIDNNRTAYRQGWFALLRVLVQNEQWDRILDGSTLPVYDKPREAAWRQWAVGLAYAAKGNPKEATKALNLMDEQLDIYQDKAKQAVPAELRVAKQELSIQILAAKNKKVDVTLAKLQKLSERQRALTYSEPPFYPRPVSDVIGRLALQAGKLDVAEKAYRDSNEQFLGNHVSEAGLREIERRKGATGAAAGGR